MKKPTRLGKTAEEILEALIDLGNVYAQWAENPLAFNRELYGVVRANDWDCLFEDRRRKQALKRLKEKRWVKNTRVGSKVEFRLHQEALIQTLKTNIRQTQAKLPPKTFTAVVFDFPEVARKARTAFRQLLKQVGFRQKQLSVWISDKDVGEEVGQIIRCMKAEKWVSVYRAQEIA